MTDQKPEDDFAPTCNTCIHSHDRDLEFVSDVWIKTLTGGNGSVSFGVEVDRRPKIRVALCDYAWPARLIAEMRSFGGDCGPMAKHYAKR